MIIDSLKNLSNYAALNPWFKQAVEFVASHDLSTLLPGKIVLDPDNLIVNVNKIGIKTPDAAKLETHRQFIDIQIPVSGPETMGYTPADTLPSSHYDADNDIAFYPGLADEYFNLVPGMFAVFFPSDGHAPGITPTGLTKIIIKVRV